MNKERLAEIEERILKIDEDDSTNRSKMLDHRHWAYELLKIANEQAERVQEIEEDCEYLSHHYGLEAEKNKRYREVINNINEKEMLYGVDEKICEAIQEAIRALESEPK